MKASLWVSAFMSVSSFALGSVQTAPVKVSDATETASASDARPQAAPIENKVRFSLSSTDGSLNYDCKHWIANPGAGDLTVICGKGTPNVKEYSVHFLVRTQPRGTATSFEVLYWVTDRNVRGNVPGFSSHSQYFTVENQTKIREFTMSEGVENDSFQLTVNYRP